LRLAVAEPIKREVLDSVLPFFLLWKYFRVLQEAHTV
jgi:hypothetical protein